MSLPRFVLGMVSTLCIFATAMVWLTGSLRVALADAAICAVAIQTGYFLLVLCLVDRSPNADDTLVHQDGIEGSQEAF